MFKRKLYQALLLLHMVLDTELTKKNTLIFSLLSAAALSKCCSSLPDEAMIGIY